MFFDRFLETMPKQSALLFGIGGGVALGIAWASVSLKGSKVGGETCKPYDTRETACSRTRNSHHATLALGTGSTFSLCLPSQVSTTNPDWAQATKAYLAHQKVNPIFGAASKA